MRKSSLQNQLTQFERMEAIKPSMKCATHDEFFSMDTDDSIEAQLEAFKQRTSKGQCDHIDIQEVFKYPKDPKRMVVRYRCCRLRR